MSGLLIVLKFSCMICAARKHSDLCASWRRDFSCRGEVLRC